MREYTKIKLINTQYSNKDILSFEGWLSFKFEEKILKNLGSGKIIKEDGNFLIFETQGYYEGIPKSLANTGTEVKIFKDWRHTDKIGTGIIQSKFFTKATSNDWKIKDALTPENSKYNVMDIVLSQEEKELLSYGSIPLQMEDKWFIYWENTYLNFIRSWTGIQIFQATLLPTTDDKWLIKEIRYREGKDFHFNSPSLFIDLVDAFLKRMKKIM